MSAGKIREFDRPADYEIRVTGYIDKVWSDWFGGLKIIHKGESESVLMGSVTDQPALHGILTKLCGLGFTLLSVIRLEDKVVLYSGLRWMSKEVSIC
ncbi:MAG: hypothetical protein P1S60_01030 [Anaerolineae bacterium]|nr:hypothetical protein [Anaerolineae bacterium]